MARIDLEKLAKEYGAGNLRFIIPMRETHSLHQFGMPLGYTSSSDPEVPTECRVCEVRYRMADGYKITLKAVCNEEVSTFYGSESYYQMDLESMIRRDPDEYRIYVLVDDDDKYERLYFDKD